MILAINSELNQLNLLVFNDNFQLINKIIEPGEGPLLYNIFDYDKPGPYDWHSPRRLFLSDKNILVYLESNHSVRTYDFLQSYQALTGSRAPEACKAQYDISSNLLQGGKSQGEAGKGSGTNKRITSMCVTKEVGQLERLLLNLLLEDGTTINYDLAQNSGKSSSTTVYDKMFLTEEEQRSSGVRRFFSLIQSEEDFLAIVGLICSDGVFSLVVLVENKVDHCTACFKETMSPRDFPFLPLLVHCEEGSSIRDTMDDSKVRIYILSVVTSKGLLLRLNYYDKGIIKERKEERIDLLPLQSDGEARTVAFSSKNKILVLRQGTKMLIIYEWKSERKKDFVFGPDVSGSDEDEKDQVNEQKPRPDSNCQIMQVREQVHPDFGGDSDITDEDINE